MRSCRTTGSDIQPLFGWGFYSPWQVYGYPVLLDIGWGVHSGQGRWLAPASPMDLASILAGFTAVASAAGAGK